MRGSRKPAWSRWKSIHDGSEHTRPAIYKIRAMKNGHPLTIQRFLDTDIHGLLCVGQTEKMERRRRQFDSGVRIGKGHSEAKLLYLLERCARLKKRLPGLVIKYSFQKKRTKAAAQNGEKEILRSYFKRFGEVPPLNSSIPARRDPESWGC